MTTNFIGIDAGKARVGFAVGSEEARLANARFTVPAVDAKERLKELIKEEEAVGVVVGLPRNLSGNDTPQTAWVRSWVETLKSEITIPIYAQDEALSTKLAEAKAMGAKKDLDIDALAAAIILQDFLDSTETERVVW